MISAIIMTNGIIPQWVGQLGGGENKNGPCKERKVL